MTQQVGPVGGYVDHDPVIGDPHRVDEARARRGGGVELQDPRMVGAETELLGGAQHAVRLDAADLLALELQPSRQHGANRGVRVGLAGLHVRRPANDFDGRPRPATGIHETQPANANRRFILQMAKRGN